MIEGFARALEHIEQHLGDEIDPAVLARYTLSSEYHFRRIFSALAGMPLSEYIRRRRLTVAAPLLAAGNNTLLDVAVRSGYSSTEAFSRAFLAFHGVTAGDALRGKGPLRTQPRLRITLTLEGDRTMDYKIVTTPAMNLVGFSTRVPLVHEGPNPAIEEFNRSVDRAALVKLKELSDVEPRGVLSVTDNISGDRSEGSELDYYLAVATTQKAPEGLAVLPLPAASWAVFSGEGPEITTIQYLWRDIFTQWFPAHSYQSAPGPELLQTEYNSDFSLARFHIWVPIEQPA
ncbi:AraC family transcriptional regulator [Arthrobacter sp. SW1]|uniref:AraC family transcriptional regulator n=1 Tax=Arthrobacter sp. SW1 TaxID=1920889 RepID=UPI000877D613|nr:AraC family transcriptional regulator [Arthrobacter sp. SW1]OFI38583.1 AraC family transcriptional regulator [Arthrobacter sp. SW1]